MSEWHTDHVDAEKNNRKFIPPTYVLYSDFPRKVGFSLPFSLSLTKGIQSFLYARSPTQSLSENLISHGNNAIYLDQLISTYVRRS